MSGLWDVLFQGSPPKSITNSATTISGFPDWYQEVLKANIANASQILAEPYTPYSAPRIADISPDQQRAFQNTRTNVGAARPMFETASDMTKKAGGPFDQAEFDKYKSPYIDGVVNRIAELGNRNLNEKILPGIRDEFVGAGQMFGGPSSGALDFYGRAVRDTSNEIAGQQAGALQSAQDAAMSSYLKGRDLTLSSANQMGGLATAFQDSNIKDSAALENIGLTQQNQQQANLDLGYSDFINQRDWFKNNAGYFNNMIQGLPNPSSTTQTGSGYAPYYNASPVGQAIGTVGGLTQLFGNGGK